MTLRPGRRRGLPYPSTCAASGVTLAAGGSPARTSPAPALEPGPRRERGEAMDSMMMGAMSDQMKTMDGMQMDMAVLQACMDACAACEQACTVCSMQMMDCAPACMNCA